MCPLFSLGVKLLLLIFLCDAWDFYLGIAVRVRPVGAIDSLGTVIRVHPNIDWL